MTITRKLTAAELNEWEMPMEAPEGGEILSDRHVANTRWATVRMVVFTLPEQPTGTAWQLRYYRPATESQEQDPWNGAKEVTAELVHEVEKVVKAWEPVMEST